MIPVEVGGRGGMRPTVHSRGDSVRPRFGPASGLGREVLAPGCLGWMLATAGPFVAGRAVLSL